eukprot:g18629.t1
MAAPEVFGDLTVKVVRGVDLQNLSVFGTCNPYVLVKMRSSVESMSTGVRESDANPSWQDSFTFRNVSSADGLQISLMEKEGSREGVVSVAEPLPSTRWGYPGFGGGERVLEVVMPCTNRKRNMANMGTIILKLQYRAELKFRAPFGVFQTAVAKTGVLTEKAKIDVAMDKTLDAIFRPIKLAGGWTNRMSKAQKIIYGGGAAAVSTAVGGGVSLFLLALSVPVVFMALLFLPLTMIGGMFFAVAVLAVLPLLLGVGWLLFCSRPVQCRIWMPSVFWAVSKSGYANMALLQPRGPIPPPSSISPPSPPPRTEQ